MLYREIIAVSSEIHTEHINTLCGQNVEFVNVELRIRTAKAHLHAFVRPAIHGGNQSASRPGHIPRG